MVSGAGKNAGGRKAPAANADFGNPTPGSWYIRAEAKNRWLAPDLKYYTPAKTEQIMRDALLGDMLQQHEMFDLMERTWPRLQTNLKKLKDRTCSVEWQVQAWSAKGKQPSAQAVRRAELLEHSIWHMRPDPTEDENDFNGLLFDLCDAWGKGISVQEIDWTPTVYEGTPLIVPRASRWIHPRCYGYPARNGLPDKLMLRQEAITGGPLYSGVTMAQTWTPFSPDKFLLAVSKQKSGHPLGAAMFAPLVFYWAAANFSWEWFINFAQIFGMPIRWATYSSHANEGTIRKIEQMMEMLGSQAWAAMPEGTQMQILDATKGGNATPQEALIDRVDAIADIIVLGQTLTTDAKKTGTQALGTVHASVMSDREKAQARWAANILNHQLIPAWCRLNFGDEMECPYLVPDIEDEEDAKLVAETFEILSRAGMKIPTQYAHDRMAIPMAKEGEQVLEPRQTPMPGMGPETNHMTDQPEPGMGPETKDAEKAVEARRADQAYLDRVMEDVTTIEAKWLRGARPWFQRLISLAQDPNVSEAQLEAALVRAQRNLPDEVAPLLDMDSLALAMEKNMGSAVVNGAVAGHLSRVRRQREAA